MYKAIYRKYRPKTFEDLIGQEHITKILQNQIQTNTISHAYLFSGTRGTGKTSCAKIFARAINCLDPDNKPCNKCENCLESLDESSIDIIEIDAASNNGVDNIRDLKDRAFYQPTSLKYKVYIIDEVHMLSKGAFNALLKILEEPPDHLVFILATTEPDRIPLTILSRCQKFQFKRIDTNEMFLALKSIAEKEGVSIDDDSYNLVINAADGSMRDAQSILEQLVSSGRDKITYDYAISLLGIVDKSNIIKIVDAIIDNDAASLIEEIDQALLQGKDTEQLAKDILDHFRNLMLAKVSPESADRLIRSNIEAYLDQSKKLSLEKILQAMEKLIDQLNEIKYSQQQRALLEITLLEVFQLVNSKSEVFTREERPQVSKEANTEVKFADVKKVLERDSENLERENLILNQREEKTEQLKEEKVSDAEEVSEQELPETVDKKLSKERLIADWKDILIEIKKAKPMVHAFIVEAVISDCVDNTICFGFHKEYGFHMDNLLKEKNRELVEKVLSLFYNTSVKINAKFIEDEKEASINKDIDTLTKLVGEENIKIF